MKTLKRASGLLLHPTSLAGKFGIGELGQTAYQWIDFLAKSGQSVWQILPLGPTGYGNSPYQTTSVFAGNPLLIDIARLAQEGYLSQEKLEQAPPFSEAYVDFDAVIDWKMPLLLEASHQFHAIASLEEKNKFKQFCLEQGELWLNEFALFMALKSHFQSISWNQWPDEIKRRNRQALAEMSDQLQYQIAAHKFLQYQFFKQWLELRAYANKKGIRILGDIPIYTTYDSADVWAKQSLFHLDEQGNPLSVAGVPPDYFSKTGQLWGNPLYQWERMKAEDYQWWVERVRINLQYMDMIRFDHFRGFEAYWAVPFGEKTAIKGEWRKGPGYTFFDILLAKLGTLPIIAEDLGLITPEVEALRDFYHFPGMKILQFAFGDTTANPFLPHNYDRNCVVYSGTHDNDTTHGWFATLPEHERRFCIKYLNGNIEDIAWSLIRLASASTASLAIFPLQDVLSLGSKARMNMPGKGSNNWIWRLSPKQLSEKYALALLEITEIYGRTVSQ